MTVDSFKKNLSIFLGALYLGVNGIFAYSTESNFWAERRKEVRRSGGVSLTLAAFPANELRGPLFPPLSPVIPTTRSFLSEEVMKGVSPSFLQKNRALFTSLSQKYGTIRKISMGAGSSSAQPIVVHIQDVHQNEEAQKNIGAVVKSALLTARVDVVALEGLSGPLDLNPFRTYQNQQAVHQAADYLLSQNEISGPVHGLLTGEGPLPTVIGIDDPTHYNANVDAYRASAPLVESYRKLIQGRANQLEKQKDTVYSIPLREFDRHIEKYRNQEISLGEYVRVLVARAKDYGIPPSLQLFSKTLELEQSMDFRQVEIERTLVIERLIERMTSQQEEALVSHSLAYRAGQMRYAEFYVALKNLCETSGVSLVAYPALDHYIRYVLLADQINGESLLRETKELEKELFGSLAKSSEERRLVDQSWKIHLTQKLVEFGLTPEEWASYVSVNESGGSLVLEETEAGEAVGTGCDLRTFEAFYKEAHARDARMATHLLRAMNKDAHVALLVTGGFHAPGIEKQLTDAGVTVVSFVPRLKTIDMGHGTTYLSVFTQEKTPLEQLFQGEKLFLANNPARPSVMKMLLPALVVVVALLGAGYGVGMDPNVLFSSLGGVGLLAGFEFLKDRVQFNISRPQGNVSVSVNIDSEKILSVSERDSVSWGNSLSEGVRNGKKIITEILVQINDGLEKNIYYPLRAHSIQWSRALVFLLPVMVALVLVGWAIFIMGEIPHLSFYAVDTLDLGSVVFGGAWGASVGGGRQISRPPEAGAIQGRSLDRKKLNSLYADIRTFFMVIENITRVNASHEEISEEEEARYMTQVSEAINQVYQRALDMSPEFYRVVGELDDESEVGVNKLFEMLSRLIFIPMGRCLPRDFHAFKKPLVIEPGSWGRVPFINRDIWMARVFPEGLVRSTDGSPGIQGLREFVFLDTEVIKKNARIAWKNMGRFVAHNPHVGYSRKAIGSGFTESDLLMGMNDWAVRMQLAKTKQAVFAALKGDMGISEVTLESVISAVLLEKGEVFLQMKAKIDSSRERGNPSLELISMATAQAYAEFLDAFYEHLLWMRKLDPEKAQILGVLTLGVILNESVGEHSRNLGARLLIDQFIAKTQVQVKSPGAPTLHELSKFIQEDVSAVWDLLRVIEEIRDDNLIRPEERFYQIFNRAPTRKELWELYSAQPLFPPKREKSTPVGARKDPSSRRSVPVVDSLLSRAVLFQPSLNQTKFGPEVLAVFERAERLSHRFSNLEESDATLESFAEFLNELTGGESESTGFRLQSRGMRNVKEVEDNASLIEDLFHEVASQVLEHELNRAQELLGGNDFEGAILRVLSLRAHGPLLDALPLDARGTIESFLESSRHLYLHARDQNQLSLGEIVEKRSLLGLDQAEVDLLGSLSESKAFGEVGASFNSWGLEILCQRLGKHTPESLLKLVEEKRTEKEIEQREASPLDPLVLRGGFNAFISDEVSKSALWTEHRKEILEKLDKFLLDCLDHQVREEKEKMDVSVGGLLLGRDLWGIQRDYLPAARFYFRVFEERGPDGKMRKAVYLIAVENKGNSSEKGGRGKINTSLKAKLLKVSEAGSTGNLEVFGKYQPLSPLRKKILGRDKKGPSSSVVAMHPVGGVGMNAFQRGLLEKKATENAPLGLRREWAEKIFQSLTNPHLKSSIDAFGLGAPVRELISLLRMETPLVRVGGVVVPVYIHLISGSPKDLPHGMPQAFGTISLGDSRKSSRVTIGVFPNDLAAVLHEGLEIILHTDPFAGRFLDKAHTYAFLGEILANKPSNGNVVPKRAMEELGKKTKSELVVFLNKGLQTLLEIRSRFTEPWEGDVRERLSEIHTQLTRFAVVFLRERGQNTVGRINQKISEIERAFAIGSFIEVESKIEELERALYHLQKERGPHPLLRHYVEGIKDRHERIQARFGDAQMATAQRFSIVLSSLEEQMRKREWVSLWQAINKLRMGRLHLPPEMFSDEQKLLFDLWDKIGHALTPIMRGGDWAEADRQVQVLEAFGLDVIRNHGIENQYLETVLFDFLAIYRAQRDLAHRQPQEAERFTRNLKILNDSSFESGPLSKEEQANVIRLLGGIKFKFAEWEVAVLRKILTRLALRLTPQLKFFLPAMGHPFSLNSHSPVFYRILSNYPGLPVSPNDLSTLFSSFISNQFSISEARGRLVMWGVSPSDADLYLLDLSELKPRPFPRIGRSVHYQRGTFLAEMSGLLFLAVLIPLAIGNGGLVFGIASLAVEPILVVGILSLSILLSLGFLGVVWWGVKFVLAKVALEKTKKRSTAQAIVAILQEESLSLGVDGGSLIRTASQYSTDRTFLSFLRETLRKSGNPLTFLQGRRALLGGLGVGTPIDVQTGALDVGGGQRPLTIFYLEGAGVPEDGNLMPVFERYLVGNGAEVVVVPVDARARKATDGLTGKIGIRVLDGLPPGAEGERAGQQYGLAKVERRLSSLGMDFDHYTGCHVVVPLGLEIDVEGIKSNLLQEALVILLDGLTAIMVRRSDLYHIDRVARAVASAA
jgi:hypothetical protein